MEKFNEEKLATSHPQSANWNPTKGNPFDFSDTDNYITCDPPLIKIASKSICDAEDYEEVLPPIITTVKFNTHFKTAFEAIKYPHQSKLIDAVEEKSYEKEKYISGRDMIMSPDGSIHVKKTPVNPVTVYLDYPFNQIAEVTINPYINDNEPFMDFGYLVWQISRAYADIYKNKWEEFGIWGHAFEDLWLEIMQIRENNIITIYVGS